MKRLSSPFQPSTVPRSLPAPVSTVRFLSPRRLFPYRSHPFTQPSPYGSVFHLVGRSASRWFGLRVFTRFTPFYTRPSSIAAQPEAFGRRDGERDGRRSLRSSSPPVRIPRTPLVCYSLPSSFTPRHSLATLVHAVRIGGRMTNRETKVTSG